MNADFNDIWTDIIKMYIYSAYFFLPNVSIKILAIPTLDFKTLRKKLEQLWQPSVKFLDVWQQQYDDFIHWF